MIKRKLISNFSSEGY